MLLPAPVRRVEDAAQRVLVRSDGALVHRHGKHERELLEPGELDSVHLVPDGAFVGGVRLPTGRGQWVLLRGRGRSVALSLPGWTPGQPSFPADPLALSGMRALLGALGHPDPGAFDLDEADPEMLAQAARPVLLDPRPSPSRRLKDPALQTLRVIVVLLFVSFIVEDMVSRIRSGGEASPAYPAGALALLAVVLAAPLVTVVIDPLLPRRRRRPPRGDATTVPGSWTASGGRPRVAVTDQGAALLVVDPDGTATAIPGPALGGAVEVFILAADGVRPTRTALLTASSEVLMALPATWWPSDEDAVHVQSLLRDAGLRTTRQRVPRAAVQPPRPRRKLPRSTGEVVVLTFCFAVPMMVLSVAFQAVLATVLTASTLALCVGLFVREWRRSG